MKTRKPVIVGARVLGEFGDDPHRYGGSKARKNYAATSPITRASGRKKIVAARYVHNNRLIDALTAQAFADLNASPGAVPSMTTCATAASTTKTRSGGWRTVSPASCTDA